VVWLQRRVLVANDPMLIQTSYFSGLRFPDLLGTYLASEEPHVFLARYYGVQIARESEVFEPVILESYEAGLLGVQDGFAALWAEAMIFDTDDEPIGCFSTLLRGDRCRFYIDLSVSDRGQGS